MHFILLGLILSIILIPAVSAESVEDYLIKLKDHYQKYPKLEVFSLNYHYLGTNDPIDTWDYKAPERYMALRMVEIDLLRKQFVERDIHHFSGGQTYNRVQFRNDKESAFYDKNGLSLGKGILRQSVDSFEEFKGFIFGNVDFLAVTPLLEEKNVEVAITLQQDTLSGKTTLTHTTADNGVVDYVFNDNPLSLASVRNHSQQRLFVYGDYQTTNGITFARSIHKYSAGETKPSFVHRIDQLHVLEKIEPARFQIPEGFGPTIMRGDGILTAQEIAQDLYLVTDSSAVRNSLFKVNGDSITVFGAAGNARVAKETIALIRDKFPQKAITSVYITHPHRNQIAGIKVFVDEGIEILADEYSIAAIKAYQRFADDIHLFKFRTITHEQIIDGAHFYVLENMHSKRQSFVHFRGDGIIFQAHFLQIARDNTIPKVIPNYTRSFIDFVRNKQLNVNRVVSNFRNNNISIETINKMHDLSF
jgi:hypothetical protein